MCGSVKERSETFSLEERDGRARLNIGHAVQLLSECGYNG